MKLEDNLMIQFLKKFDENPFLIKINGKEVLVGEGKPAFVVRFNKSLDIKELRRSTSLAPVSYTHLIADGHLQN